jgi:hypothetical protein
MSYCQNQKFALIGVMAVYDASKYHQLSSHLGLRRSIPFSIILPPIQARSDSDLWKDTVSIEILSGSSYHIHDCKIPDLTMIFSPTLSKRKCVFGSCILL